MLEKIPNQEPEPWLKKQQCIQDGKPTVAGILLFADEPQAAMPKRCGIKISRYKTSDPQGTRDTMDFDPITIEGCAYDQIKNAVVKTVEIVENISVWTATGLEKVKYPKDTLHEIVTNAVLHRDYSLADDIHIRIFDNRIEVDSPGKLPAHITVKNILEERFSRNGTVVRLINKFPDPPNKDVGEGLNTAFEAMRKLRLKNPLIEERGNSVLVHIRHEPLASPEDTILEYLEHNVKINNTEARVLCSIGSASAIQKTFEKLVKQDLIERVPGLRGRASAYRKNKV
jgi:ATP-dependent DNA helicase RecG